MKSLQKWIILLFPFLIQTDWKSMEAQSDPLLRRPWIATSSAEEERFFNRVQTISKSKPYFVVKQDDWGRNYKLKNDGSATYLLDESYRQKFPTLNNIYLGYREATALADNGHWIPAIHLLNGIEYCIRINASRLASKTSSNKDISKLKNRLLQANSDKNQEIEILTDPYGCIHENKLFLESKAFSYQIEVPLDLSWEYVKNPEDITGIYEDYSFRYQRLYKILKRDDKQKDSQNENVLSIKDDMDEKYELANQGLLHAKSQKIIFFIGTCFQKKGIFNVDNFFRLWDVKRGINSATTRELKFRRKEKAPGYESSLVTVDEFGVSQKIMIREHYYWKKNKGIFLSISYPESESEEMEKNWQSMISSFRVRD
ncbi:hypothetical protein [Leptospira sp. GIMC2001]|uniref:hypothetical protein n=1 Tax=Leptospira sp. GIMC2001 TaxID=1513297 RepID=UPI00234B7C33|nr:hypothetical protein [Leptospira sp. GIMC2001]WCL48337.1 hypothetical protein O4O04_13610 [Leptospira sp. GIMC2001]